MQKSKTSVLIIDDDDSLVATLLQATAKLAVGGESLRSPREGVAFHNLRMYDVVLIRDGLVDGSLSDTIAEFQSIKPAPEIIVYTSRGDQERAELALKAGVWDYVIEQNLTTTLPAIMRRAIRYRQSCPGKAEPGMGSVSGHFAEHGIIGKSLAMQNCIDLAVRIAQSDANVLIYGESGTGKELFASAIHRFSSRANKEMTIVDCAALPASLVESILFGHTKGSFTGADKTQQGLVEKAHGGTLFLDEIGELPLAIQGTLLRVIQERTFLPVGATVEKKSEFRLIAATNRDLEAMSRNRTFREDLLFRLKTFYLELPTLRSHESDIAELATYCRDRYCEQHGIRKKAISPDYLMVLKQYEWPGNVRELFQAVERSIAAARDSIMLHPKHLSPEIRIKVAQRKLGRGHAPLTAMAMGGDLAPSQELAAMTLKQAREVAIETQEKVYLENLLETTRGDIRSSCRIAGLSRSRLYDLLKKYQLATRK